MFQINAENLVEAVKKARSPKMALDGTKLLLGNSEGYKLVFEKVFELVWRDATYRNRAIERSAGRKADIMWRPRISPDEQAFQASLLAFRKTKSSRKSAKVLGKVLCEYDQASIQKFFAVISEKEESSQSLQSSYVP